MAASAPLVRETITQYINLLKRLTGQNTNTRMSEQIVKTVLASKENLVAYYELIGAQTALQKAVLAKLEGQCRKIAGELSLEFKFNSDLAKKEGSFSFFDAYMEKNSIFISFQFRSENFNGLSFGISYLSDTTDKNYLAPLKLRENFEREFGTCKSVPWWAAVKEWRYRNLSYWSEETLTDIAFGLGSFQEELKDRVEKLAKIVRQAQDRQSK